MARSDVRGRAAVGAGVLALAVAVAQPLASDAAVGRPSTTNAGATPALIALASAATSGQLGNGSSGAAKVSADCSTVVFSSAANNLVKGDRNKANDVFARRPATGATILVSRALDGGVADADSRTNGVSANGRFVVYDSSASDLVKHDTLGHYDVFVRDLRKHRSERVSVPEGGGFGDQDSYRPSISSNGRLVAFDSFASNLTSDPDSSDFDVYLRDRTNRTTTLVSAGVGGAQPNGGSDEAAISGNGRFIVYESLASNLVDDDTNGLNDVFRYDDNTGLSTLVSVGADGGPSDGASSNADISANGRYVVFTSLASDLVDGDGNDTADVFVRDMMTGTTTRVSVSSSGGESNRESLYGSLSTDGSVVTFDSFAKNLVAHDTNRQPDVFVHVMATGATRRVSVSAAGAQGRGGSFASAIADSGACVAFTSSAPNLVKRDTNDVADVFLRRLATRN